MKKEMKLISWMLFLFGILGAIVLGLLEGTSIWSAPALVGTILVIIGALIGLLNITNKEAMPFMISVLVIAGGATALAIIPAVGNVIQTIFAKIALVAVPAGLVVAMVTIYNKAK